MARFIYDSNGRSFNRELDTSVFDEVLDDESQLEGSAQPMRISGKEAIGSATKIERYYTFHTLGVVTLMKRERLAKRQLASGLYVYEAPREVQLESGREAMMPSPNDVIAFNYSDFENPPEDITPFRHEHTLWVAQALINYDFGVQAQEQARARL